MHKTKGEIVHLVNIIAVNGQTDGKMYMVPDNSLNPITVNVNLTRKRLILAGKYPASSCTTHPCPSKKGSFLHHKGKKYQNSVITRP